LSDRETISVTVVDVNHAPVLAPIGNRSVNEGAVLVFQANATDEDAGQALTFTLTNAPNGASIDGSTGVFTWTPAEGDGPGQYTFDVMVTDNGSPALSDGETIMVTVDEINAAPILAAIGNNAANVDQPLTFTASAMESCSLAC
jgi:hypothetical protein